MDIRYCVTEWTNPSFLDIDQEYAEFTICGKYFHCVTDIADHPDILSIEPWIENLIPVTTLICLPEHIETVGNHLSMFTGLTIGNPIIKKTVSGTSTSLKYRLEDISKVYHSSINNNIQWIRVILTSDEGLVTRNTLKRAMGLFDLVHYDGRLMNVGESLRSPWKVSFEDPNVYVCTFMGTYKATDWLSSLNKAKEWLSSQREQT